MFFKKVVLLCGFSLLLTGETLAARKAYRDLEDFFSLEAQPTLKQRPSNSLAEEPLLKKDLKSLPGPNASSWVAKNQEAFLHLKDFAYFSRLAMRTGISLAERKKNTFQADICLQLFRMSVK